MRQRSSKLLLGYPGAWDLLHTGLEPGGLWALQAKARGQPPRPGQAVRCRTQGHVPRPPARPHPRGPAALSQPASAAEDGPWLGRGPRAGLALAWVQAPRPPEGSGGTCLRKVLTPVPT